MTSTITLVISIVTGAYAFFAALLRFTQDAKEPPAIETWIPFLSPLLGLILGMQKFTIRLRLVASNILCMLLKSQY